MPSTGTHSPITTCPQEALSAIVSAILIRQSATRLFYSIDTAPGQSGAPIYHYNSTTAGLCGGWCVTGIHKGATGSQNHGTRFNPTVMSFINYWISQP